MDAKTLCLGALMIGDASGYQIRKLFEDGAFGHIHDISFGSIYPALTSLLDRKLATCRVENQDGRPDKKVYSITEAGREAFLDALSTPPSPDKMRSEMLFILAFGDHLPRHRVLALIDQYIDEFEARLADLNACEAECREEMQPVGRFVHDFGKAMYETAVDYLRENRIQLEASSAASKPIHVNEPLAAAGGH